MRSDHIDQFGFGHFEFFGEHTDKKKEASLHAHHHQQSRDLITGAKHDREFEYGKDTREFEYGRSCGKGRTLSCGITCT